MRGPKPFCQLVVTFHFLVLATISIGRQRIVNTLALTQTQTQARTQTKDSAPPAPLPFEAKFLSVRLQKIREEKVICIKSNGINPDGFDYCCGKKYDKIDDTFLNQYKIIELEFEKIFVKAIRNSCFKDEDPCDELILFIEQNLPRKENILPLIASKVQEVRKGDGVSGALLDQAMLEFRKNYAMFMQARALIASFLLDTINDIQTVIRTSGVANGFDYETVDPVEELAEIGVIDLEEFNSDSFGLDKVEDLDDESLAPTHIGLPTIMPANQRNPTLAMTQTSSVSVSTDFEEETDKSLIKNSSSNLAKPKKQFSSILRPLDLKEKLKLVEQEVDQLAYPLITDKPKTRSGPANFNIGLLKEIDARDKIHALIGKSLVDESRLDKTKMPSDILRDIQNNKLIIDPKY
jgi:hypothetical protein